MSNKGIITTILVIVFTLGIFIGGYYIGRASVKPIELTRIESKIDTIQYWLGIESK